MKGIKECLVLSLNFEELQQRSRNYKKEQSEYSKTENKSIIFNLKNFLKNVTNSKLERTEEVSECEDILLGII